MLYKALQCLEGRQGNFVEANRSFCLLPQSHMREVPDPAEGIWRGPWETMTQSISRRGEGVMRSKYKAEGVDEPQVHQK